MSLPREAWKKHAVPRDLTLAAHHTFMMSLRFSVQISQLPLFSGRTTQEMQTLLAGGEDFAIKHRQVLFYAGDKAEFFYIIIEGAFKLLRRGSEGSDVIVHFATPGDVVAALVMQAAEAVYPVTCVAMGHAIVLKLPRSTFLKSWAGNPLVQQCLGGNLFARMNHMQIEKAMGKSPLAQKIARQLVSIIERYSGENQTILPIPFTRQEIADSVGASVESVIRIMSDWSRNGIISTSDQLIRIEKMDKILEIVKGVEQE